MRIVTPEVQAHYMKYVLDTTAKSGYIKRVFWFTVNYGKQANTLDPPEGPLPAFFLLQNYIQQYPLWTKRA